MQDVRGRSKKLKLALHFHAFHPARWSCEECRRAGLEEKRRCGFLRDLPDEEGRVSWVSGDIVSPRCPKSVITSESLRWLELFQASRWHQAAAIRLNAKDVDAMKWLERWASEVSSNE